jgi:CubicO group peptidase (beta-lactamase class C family)
MTLASEPSGSVKPGFEPVGEAFRANFADHGELGAAAAARVGGEVVVDLWGGVADAVTGRPWERDTMVVIHSATKGVAALAAAMLVDRGLLGYEQPVARFWPEFAEGGKERVTVGQLLSHQAGLVGLDAPITLEEIADGDRLAPRLAAQTPWWPPGSGHGYHAITFGIYAGELVRRVDPDHRSIGRFIAQEIAQPLGASTYVGLPNPLNQRVAPLVHTALHAAFDPDRPFVQALMDPSSLTARAMFAVPELPIPGTTDRPEVRALEIASATGISDARSLASIYSAADTLCGPATLTDATATVVDGDDLVILERTSFAMGFMKPMTAFFRISPNQATFGHPGVGGSMAFHDPTAGVSFAYVTNSLRSAEDDRRAMSLAQALYDCL